MIKGFERYKDYLKDYIGYTDDEPDRILEEKALKCAFEKTPDKIRNLFRRKNRELFYIWMFLSAEGLQEEAEKYLAEKVAFRYHLRTIYGFNNQCQTI